MPQFQRPFTGQDDGRAFQDLDAFTQGYVEAMFFTETGTGDDEDLEYATFADLAPETLEKIKADCAAFQVQHGPLLTRAYDMGFAQGHYDDERAGNDFWYSRNGHGTGFWDRHLNSLGDDLHRYAGSFGHVYLYRGDPRKDDDGDELPGLVYLD